MTIQAELNLSGGTCAGSRKACGNTSATHTEPETQAGYTAQMIEQLAKTDFGELFQKARYGELKGMVHIPDHDTSIEAAHKVKEVKLKLHGEILDHFSAFGPMTDEELEKMPRFQEYGPSTIRKRRSELYQAGKLVATGERRVNSRGSRMKVWAIENKACKPCGI